MNHLRSLVLVVAVCMSSSLSYSAGSQPSPSIELLGSSVFSWDGLAVKTTSTGARRDVVDRPTATLERFECHISTLNPGKSSHPPHQHAQEEFIILKDGALDVSINGVVHHAGPGSWFFFASNDWHNLTNTGETPATYLVFNVATAATHGAPAEGAAKTAAPGTLSSAVFDWEKMAREETKTGARRSIFDAPTVTCKNLEAHVTTLNPGLAPHAAHHHPDEELIIVKEGFLEVTINRVAHRVGAGAIIFIGSQDEHALRNPGDVPATYFVLRVVTAATPRAE